MILTVMTLSIKKPGKKISVLQLPVQSQLFLHTCTCISFLLKFHSNPVSM